MQEPNARTLIDEFFQTDDIGVAETIVRREYPRAELRACRPRFRLEQSTRGGDGVSFARFAFASEIGFEVDLENVAAFGLVLGGRYSGESNGCRLDTARPFIFTPGRGASRSDHLDLLMVNVDLGALERRAAERLGVERSTVRFAGTAPVSGAMERHWMRTIGYAWKSVVQIDEVFRNDLVRTATMETVLAAALAAFPLDVSRPWGLPSAQTHPAGVRRARSFMEENPDRPLTVAAIAEAANTSVRALQIGFQRELGMTPTAFLRQVRLRRARDDLKRSDPHSTTVSQVAAAWGFSNVGRFSVEYRALFGERPVETLRR
jgi:AraC-like DNA-binding protein